MGDDSGANYVKKGFLQCLRLSKNFICLYLMTSSTPGSCCSSSFILQFFCRHSWRSLAVRQVSCRALQGGYVPKFYAPDILVTLTGRVPEIVAVVYLFASTLMLKVLNDLLVWMTFNVYWIHHTHCLSVFLHIFCEQLWYSNELFCCLSLIALMPFASIWLYKYCALIAVNKMIGGAFTEAFSFTISLS